MTHCNTVLMMDTHAGLAPVLEEEGRSVSPNMHRHHTVRATDNMREGWSGRGVAGKQRGKTWETVQMNEDEGVLDFYPKQAK